MSSLSEISIKKPVFAWMLMAALIVFGYINFSRMGISQLPDVDFPVVNINISWEGAAPEVMELDVIDPVESALLSIEGIQNISSSARSGSASITLEFALSKNIDVAVQEVQTKLSQVQRQLPKGIDPPIVSKSNPEDQPIMFVSVSTDKLTPPELMSYVRDHIKDRFAVLPGVSDVFLGGFIDPNIRVWVRPETLNRYSLTITDIINAIESEHTEPPSGRVVDGERELNVRTMGEAKTLDEFKKISIQKRGGAPNFLPMPLDQVSHIEYGLADIRRKSRTQGLPSIGLGIRKQRGSNAVEVGRLVQERVAEVSKTLPEGVKIAVASDSTRFIREAVSELTFTLFLSALLTAVVCWGFLGSWSSTMNVVLAIPTSVFGSFIILNILNFTLNSFTLLGLSLAIGIIVDDSIMVLENIFRHREHGESRRQAALNGSREITFAAIAATAAIIAIFLPVAFMKGIIGKYFLQFGVTISVAVAFSLLEALTLTPMRCAEFVDAGERTTRVGKAIEGLFELFNRAYGRILPFLLHHRWKTVVGSLAFFALSMVLIVPMRKEFVPSEDQSALFLRIRTPEGSTLEVTDEIMKQVEKMLMERKDVVRYYGSVGGFGGGDVNTAVVFVTLKPRSERALSQQEISEELRGKFKTIKGGRVIIQETGNSFGGRRSYPVDYSVQGGDWDQLIKVSRELMKEMEKTGLLSDIDSDYRGGASELHIIPDRDRALRRGVSITDIGDTLSALLGGAIAGKFSMGGHRFDIRVKIEPDENVMAQNFSGIMVRNNRGELVPLDEVVTVKKEEALLSITRENRSRSIRVYANVKPKVSQAEALAQVEEAAKKLMSGDLRVVPSGSTEQFRETMQSLIVALALGILVAYMIMASQFNSFIHPITVLVALPFSLSGAIIALYLSGQSINMYSMIGILLLMGIVKKNSILLVDFANQVRDHENLTANEAILRAGPLRLRPILMTSFATIAGAIPPALAYGPGAESRVPMAVAVLGGVAVSTLLTLFVVPSVYSLFSGLERRTPSS